jgi:hypothetical protein
MKSLIAFMLLLIFFSGVAQDERKRKLDTIPRKGSYLYKGQPLIEDNSMFIEEAFNQETGIIQHISNLVLDEGSISYSYTQEIPLDDFRHQLSFTIPYSKSPTPSEAAASGNDQYLNSGLGDIYVNYRPLLWGKKDWALVIPRFTLIIPTGNAQYGLGGGAWGGQFNMAVTKRLSKQLVSHWNAGFTYFSNSDYYAFDTEGRPLLTYQRDLATKNIGASIIWFAKPKFNLMLEYISNFEEVITSIGSVENLQSMTLNPGFRFAIDIGKVQIVPGYGMPFNFENGQLISRGAFIYLSIEPAY